MLNLPMSGGGGGASTSSANNWTAVQTFTRENSAGDTVLRPIVLTRTSTGTPAAGMGVGITFTLEDDSGLTVDAGRLDLVWSDASTASVDSTFSMSIRIAGVFTEVMRLGAGTSPDADVTFAVGRCLLDSRGSDTLFLSHRDMTTSLNYAVRQNASGATFLNCASGQTANIAHNTTIRIQVNTTGIGLFGATPVAINTGWTTFSNLTSDKTCDANATTVEELADILGTLIETLKTAGCFISA